MASPVLADAFEAAKKEFLTRLPKGIPANFEKVTSIDEVYKSAEAIQSAQARTRTTRNLRKIEPFLECLRHYGEVIETFVTIKPDILALIWGPIKFLLLTASTYLKSFDKLVDVMAQIGHSLPAFEKYTELFRGDQTIQRVLCLFYQDILDFYSTLLAVFKPSRLSVIFETLWPKSAERIRIITENVEKHRILMDGSVTLAHVVEAHEGRRRALEEFERQHVFRQRQDFEAVRSSLNPILYDSKLESLKARRVIPPGQWLLGQEAYTHWVDPNNKASRLLWLQGIPGAGKTFLSSSIIECISHRGDPMVFCFLDYQFRENNSTLRLLQSFLWQMALDHDDLKTSLILAYQQHYRHLHGNLSFVKDLFGQFLDLMPITFIVIDGLDEILQGDRVQFLRTMTEILQTKSNVKVLISSRPEDDISKIILKDSQPIRVHDNNNCDIEAYVKAQATSIISDARIADSGLAHELSTMMKAITVKSKGMFLYARLVCDSIGLLGDVESIRDAVDDLPEGLNEAYDRILSRITEGLESRQRNDARQILAMITCCVVPLSKNEIQLAVYTANGRDPSKGCRGLFLNILDRCGPIIEEADGHFRFVHFSAREYLLSFQSNFYLTEPTAHACVALMCIRYLNSSCFDVDIDDNTLSLYTRSGAYVLLPYVCNNWLHHIGKVGTQDYQVLIDDVGHLLEKRANSSFKFPATELEPQDVDNSSPTGSTEEVKRMLRSAQDFSKKRKRDLNFDDDQDWNGTDPLTFTETEARSRLSLESMLCEPGKHRTDCSCQDLKNLHGSNVYKCGRPGCPWYRVGFDTKSKRDGHMRKHARPFKCQDPGCQFSSLGFVSKADLEVHSAQTHNRNLRTASGAAVECMTTASEEELKAILIDAVQENDLSIIWAEADAVRNFVLDLLLSAYRGRASDAMIKHLIGQIPPTINLNNDEHQICIEIFKESLEHGNYELFRRPCELYKQWWDHDLFLSRINVRKINMRKEFLRHAGRTRRADLVEILLSRLKEINADKHNFPSVLRGVIPRRPDPQAEISTLECLQALLPHLSQYLNNLLEMVGDGCCSVSIAEFLLANGAAIEGTSGSGKFRTPVSSAARRTTREAAEFMSFMVSKGAKTSRAGGGKPLSECPGPKNVQNWIGITWEELVNQKAELDPGNRQEASK